MYSMWAVVLMIFASPLCSGHLPFFGYYSRNRNKTKDVTGIRLNNSINIIPSSGAYVKPIYASTSKPVELYQLFPVVTHSTVSIHESKYNVSDPTFQSLSSSIIPYATAVPTTVIKTEIMNDPDQSHSSTAAQPTVDPIELTIFQKHEFDGEVPDDEYPDTDECVNNTVSLGSGQEIDETRNCSSNTTTSTENTQEIDESSLESDDSSEARKMKFNFSLGSLIPPVSELPKIKMPTLAKLPLEFLGLKVKTVTLTNFIVKPSTVYASQYASCLQLENVYSVCNQKLITLEPASVVRDHSTMYKRDFKSEGRMNFELRDTSVIEEDKPPVHSQSEQKLAFSAKAHSFVDSVLEPSELDYEFEELSPKITNSATLSEATPNLKAADALLNAWTMAKDDEIIGLKIKKIDFIIPSVTTTTHFNYDLTATVIAQNCLPLNLNIPFCSPLFVHQSNADDDNV